MTLCGCYTSSRTSSSRLLERIRARPCSVDTFRDQGVLRLFFFYLLRARNSEVEQIALDQTPGNRDNRQFEIPLLAEFVRMGGHVLSLGREPNRQRPNP